MSQLRGLEPTIKTKQEPIVISKVQVEGDKTTILMSDGSSISGKVVIDGLFFKQRGGAMKCHLAAESIELLHLFAKACNIKPHWFENKKGRNQPHYDISESDFKFIKEKGIPVIGKEIIAFLKFHFDNVEKHATI